MNRVLGIQHYGKVMPSIQINIRTFAGGHGDDVVSNTPGYDQGQNDVNNPFLWDPHYQPAEESDFDRDPQEVRLRQPLPRESFVPSDEVMGRIQHILRGMERAQTDGKTMNMTTHLANDLGLDSLDQVLLSIIFSFFIGYLFVFSDAFEVFECS